jgi:hypothetical protein
MKPKSAPNMLKNKAGSKLSSFAFCMLLDFTIGMDGFCLR